MITMRQVASRYLPIDNTGFLRTTTSCTHPGSLDLSDDDDHQQQQHYHDLKMSSVEFWDTLDRSGDVKKHQSTVTLQQALSSRKAMKEAEHWVRTNLDSDLYNVTPQNLQSALEKQAPIHVIKFIMGLNPKVMSIPKTGPTPLQVAVRHGASLEVIQLLLETCPFGLCVTNPDHPEDPLSYAKRHHKDRPGLIELLSRPLIYWVTESKNQQRKASRDDETVTVNSRTSSTPLIPSSFSSRHEDGGEAMTPSSPRQQTDVETIVTEKTSHAPTLVEREEIENIKTLCSQLLRAHKKMNKQVLACKNYLELHANLIESINNTKSDILIQMEEQQKHHFYRQLIALDMKEKAYKAKLRKIQKSHVGELESRMKGWKETMKAWTESTKEQIDELQFLFDTEATINAHFRNDLAEWLEEQQRDECRNVPTFVFATNLGEINEKAPLCGNSSNGIEVTLNHVKKRPWRTRFKHCDRRMFYDLDDNDDEM
jgi:hypothetical protein